MMQQNQPVRMIIIESELDPITGRFILRIDQQAMGDFQKFVINGANQEGIIVFFQAPKLAT